MNEMLESVKRALIIVAHPDDECIFTGGIMLSYPKIEWEVICMTYGLNDPRGQEFRNAIEAFKKEGVNILFYKCLGRPDRFSKLAEEDIDDWGDSLKDNRLIESRYIDLVLTHNIEGEYGHDHHKRLNRIVHSLYNNVWEFICPGSFKIAPQPFKKKIVVIPLTEKILAKKTEIFNTCYKSQLETWRARPDVMNYEFWTGPEMFTSNA